MSSTTTPCLCLSPDTSIHIEKGQGSGGGVRLSCYHVGTLCGTASFLEYSTFCFRRWRDFVPVLDQHVQYLPQGCQEFQPLASRQTSSLKAKVRSELGPTHFFFFLLKSAGCTRCRAPPSKTRMPTTDGRASLSFQTLCGSANSGNAWELLKKKRDYRSMLAATTTVLICFVVQSSGALALTTACWDERQPEAEGNSSCICKFVVVVFPPESRTNSSS